MTAPIAAGGSGIYPATAELAQIPRWVCWKLERRNGQLSKVPYSVGGRFRAKSTDPRTWSAFEDAWRSAFVDGDAAGIGVVVDGSDDLMGADLDHCIHESGVVMPWARIVVRKLNSYTERSPSGTGLRVFFRSTRGQDWGSENGKPKGGRKVRFQDGHLELYRDERYLTVTGAHLEDTPENINFVEPDVIAELLTPATANGGEHQPGPDPKPATEIPDDLRDRLNDAMADDALLWEIWNGQAPEAADQTRSAFDLKLAGALHRHGGFSLEDFATLARWWDYGKGKDGDPRHWRRTWDKAAPEKGKRRQFPRFLLGAEFIAGYKPRRPLIKEWDLKTGWLYSLTGPTGSAKTAIALAEAFRLAMNGLRIVYLAGENPDDVRARVILMLHRLGLAEVPPPLRFVDQTFNLVDGMDHVRAEVSAIGGADFIIVDTSPAFQVASGEMDENSNREAIQWAQRLRQLSRLDGEPAVLALCHPIKRPQSIEDCVPRGGGGFLAEVDGNYATWETANAETKWFFQFTWTGKFRGFFPPITYQVERATCPDLVDSDGNPVYSVWAKRADEETMAQAEFYQIEDEDALLFAMDAHPGQSLAHWATLLGWLAATGAPDKGRVDRAAHRLKKEKLARIGRGRRWQLLAAGKAEAKRVVERTQNAAV